jgi:hypothetical protein
VGIGEDDRGPANAEAHRAEAHDDGRKRTWPTAPHSPPRRAGEPGVDPAVHFRADSVDKALGHRVVVVPPKFRVSGDGRTNLVARCLFHEDKLHRVCTGVQRGLGDTSGGVERGRPRSLIFRN